jgi:hypothetical protein
MSATFSLTPRLIAVKGERPELETVLTVFLSAQMSVPITPVRLAIRRRIKEWQKETVKTVLSVLRAVLTAINRGVNERATRSLN